MPASKSEEQNWECSLSPSLAIEVMAGMYVAILHLKPWAGLCQLAWLLAEHCQAVGWQTWACWYRCGRAKLSCLCAAAVSSARLRMALLVRNQLMGKIPPMCMSGQEVSSGSLQDYLFEC